VRCLFCESSNQRQLGSTPIARLAALHGPIRRPSLARALSTARRRSRGVGTPTSSFPGFSRPKTDWPLARGLSNQIEKIVRSGAPIAGFGVGTSMGVSADAPTLNMVYKLTSYAGHDRVKTSPGKETYPGRKQVFRQEEGGHYVRDILAGHEEKLPGTPLLRQVMAAGKRLPAGREALSTARANAHASLITRSMDQNKS
jgi:hypothetical protein